MLNLYRNNIWLINIDKYILYYYWNANKIFIDFSNFDRYHKEQESQILDCFNKYIDKVKKLWIFNNLFSLKRREKYWLQWYKQIKFDYNNLVINQVSLLEWFIEGILKIYFEIKWINITLNNEYFKKNNFKYKWIAGKIEYLIKELNISESYYYINDIIYIRNKLVHNLWELKNFSKIRLKLSFYPNKQIVINKNDAEIFTDLLMNFYSSISDKIHTLIYDIPIEKEKLIWLDVRSIELLKYLNEKGETSLDLLYKYFWENNKHNFLNNIRIYQNEYCLFYWINVYHNYSKINLDNSKIWLTQIWKIYLLNKTLWKQ